MNKFFLIAPLAALIFLFQSVAMADRHYIETIRTQPAYNEATKSYFQYIEHAVAQRGINWVEANRIATQQNYKGVNGRLAVIRDAEVHNFLRHNFAPQTEAWIGLRYFCSFRKSMWVNGDIMERQDFQYWDARWYRNDGITCEAQPGGFQYMPVYYTPSQSGFRWQASGPAKKFYGFFIEYDMDGE